MLKKIVAAACVFSACMTTLAYADVIKVPSMREMPWHIENTHTWYVFPLPQEYTFTLKVNKYRSTGKNVLSDTVTLVCGKQTTLIPPGGSAVCSLKGVDDAYYHVFPDQFHNGAEGVMVRDDE